MSVCFGRPTNKTGRDEEDTMKTETVLMRRAIIFLMTICYAMTDGKFKPRTNLGYTSEVIDKVQLYSGFVRLIYHLQLDDFTFHSNSVMKEELEDLQRLNYMSGETPSKYAAKIAIKLHKMKRDIVIILQERQTEIKELLFDINVTNRTRRSLGDWIGGGLSHIFSLATKENLDDIKHLLTRVLSGTKEATLAWRAGQTIMTKITSVTGKRLDHFARLLHLTQQSLSAENRRLQILHREHHATNKITSITIEDIHLAIVNLHQIDSIYQSLLQLSKGRLSNHLVNSTLLTTGIKDMSKKLKSVSPEHELTYTDPNYYYTRATVGGAVHKDRNTHVLLVIIQAPTVLRVAIAPLNVWKMTYFALKSPDNQGFYSILNNGPKFIAHSENNPFYFTADDAHGLPFYITTKRKVAEHLVRISSTRVQLFTKNKQTCALALMNGSLSDMKMLCELHVLYRTLTPAVHVLSDGKLLVTNIDGKNRT